MKKISLNPIFTLDEHREKKGVILSFKKFSELVGLIEDLQDIADVAKIKKIEKPTLKKINVGLQKLVSGAENVDVKKTKKIY